MNQFCEAINHIIADYFGRTHRPHGAARSGAWVWNRVELPLLRITHYGGGPIFLATNHNYKQISRWENRLTETLRGLWLEPVAATVQSTSPLDLVAVNVSILIHSISFNGNMEWLSRPCWSGNRHKCFSGLKAVKSTNGVAAQNGIPAPATHCVLLAVNHSWKFCSRSYVLRLAIHAVGLCRLP